MKNNRLILLGVAVVTAIAALSWHFFWIQPEIDCRNQRGLWDRPHRQCARTVTLLPIEAPLAVDGPPAARARH